MQLISFELCPFVQRSVITALKKKIDFDITYIDLKKKPDWFLKLSPTGKVPVLNLGNNKVLFESAVINEYLDEISEGSLLPKDTFERAKMRAYIEFASALNVSLYLFMIEKNQDTRVLARKKLYELMDRLEEALNGGAYFNGMNFTLVDSSIAPFLMRLDYLVRNNILDKTPGHSKINELQKSLLSLDYVVKSIPDFDLKFSKYISDEKLFDHNS